MVRTDAAPLERISQLAVDLFLTPLFRSLEPYQPGAEGTALLRLTLGDLGRPWTNMFPQAALVFSSVIWE